MNTDDINAFLENMTRESQKEIEQIRSEAQQRIRVYKEQSAKELSDYINVLREEHERYVRETLAMERNRWSLEFRRKKLQRFEMFLNERIDDAISDFRMEKRDDYTKWMLETLGEIVDEAGASPVEISISPDDYDLEDVLLGEYVRKGGSGERFILKHEIFAICGGMRVLFLDKRLLYDATVERILYRCFEDIRLSVRDSLENAGQFPADTGGESLGN